MGNNSSRTADDNYESSEASRDLYTVLGVSEEATGDEIKKAFRKAALQFHPDKNPDRVEWAQQQFITVQRAYEVLSDDQERAFYDRNREELARGGAQAADVDLKAKRQTERAPHLSTRQLMRFFDTSAWSGFNDSDRGFYNVYGTLFDLIAKDEILAQPYPGEPLFTSPAPDYPSFGNSASLYDRDSDAGTAVKHFYAIFQHNFATRKAFASADEYRTSDAPDRRYKRAMEKENKKAREEARREYNETVRSLAAFLKKRDPRFLASTSQDPMKARAEEMAKMRADLRQAAVDRALQRQREAEEYEANQQEWQKSKQHAFSEDEEGVSGEEQEGWHCAACDKTFLSQGGWDNHERSKKHIKTVEQLRRQMLADDAEFDFTPKQYMTEDTSEAQATPVASTSRSPSPLQEDLQESDPPLRLDTDSEDERPRQQLGKKGRRKAKKQQQQVQSDSLRTSAGQSESGQKVEPLNQRTQTDYQTEEGIEHSLKNVALEERASAEPEEPQLSKREKRRAREKAKAAEKGVNGGSDDLKCNVCEMTFTSRTKLFHHVKMEGHALADGFAPEAAGFAGGKKGKKGNRK